MEKSTYKTAECVSPAHPDKLCDQISDIILDACLEQDPDSRVAIETMGGHGQIYITGELTTRADVDIQRCVDTVLSDNRYNPNDYRITTSIVGQSPDIARGVNTGGAGDQGIMVGYATWDQFGNMPANFIPVELSLSRFILQTLWSYFEQARDSKSQVTLLD
jgi:S-adenosylmethionine synthetase